MTTSARNPVAAGLSASAIWLFAVAPTSAGSQVSNGHWKMRSPCVSAVSAPTISYHGSFVVMPCSPGIQKDFGFPGWEIGDRHFLGKDHFAFCFRDEYSTPRSSRGLIVFFRRDCLGDVGLDVLNRQCYLLALIKTNQTQRAQNPILVNCIDVLRHGTNLLVYFSMFESGNSGILFSF